MILDRLAEASRYERLHPAFSRAFDFLRRTDLGEIPAGRHELDGANLYVNVERVEGRGRSGVRLEAHRKYIDIQYTMAGAEEMGWKPLSSCAEVDQAYDEGQDIGFFRDKPETWIAVPPGHFAVFFPSDAHAPLAGKGSLHKLIVKVAVEQPDGT